MPKDIGATIRRLRKEAGLSQEKLAERLGVTSQAVSKWEVGAAMPDVTMIHPLADVFGVTTDTLLGVSDGDAEEALRIHSLGYGEVSLEKRYEVFRDGLRRVPRNGKLLEDAINTGYRLAQMYRMSDAEKAERFFNETVSLCNRQLESSRNPNELSYARFVLAVLYAMYGQSVSADGVAAQFPTYDAIVASGAVKAAIHSASGEPFAEIETRIDNVMQILLAVTNEMSAIRQAYETVRRSHTAGGGDDMKLSWTAEFQKLDVDARGFMTMAFDGDWLYYFSGDFRELLRCNIISGERELVYSLPEDAAVRGHFVLLKNGTMYYTVREQTDSAARMFVVRVSNLPDAPAVTRVALRHDFGLNESIYGQFGVDRNGRVYLSTAKTACVFSGGGELIKTIDLGERNITNNTAVTFADGRVGFVGYLPSDEIGGSGTFIMNPVNPEALDWDAPLEIRRYTMNPYTGSGKYLYFFVGADDSLYGYNAETRELDDIVSLKRLAVNTNQVVSVYQPEGGSIRVLSVAAPENGERAEQQTRLDVALLSRKATDADNRATVRVASCFGHGSTAERVAALNRCENSFLYDYVAYTDFDDYRSDVLAGKAGDVMEIGTLFYKPLIEKGLLADLKPLLETDASLNRELLTPYFFNAAESDGELFFIAPEYKTRQLAGRPEIIGAEPELSFDDLLALCEKHPGAIPVYNWTAERAFVEFMSANIDEFVDWRTMESDFTDALFQKILEVCKRFPVVKPEIKARLKKPVLYITARYSSLTEKEALADGSVLMTDVDLHFVEEITLARIHAGGNVALKDFPSRTGRAIQIEATRLLAINASCENKAAAWRLISDIIINGAFSIGIPLYKPEYDRKNAQALEIQYKPVVENGAVKTDADGNPVYELDENGERVIANRWGRSSLPPETENPDTQEYREKMAQNTVWLQHSTEGDLEMCESALDRACSIGHCSAFYVIDLLAAIEPYFAGGIAASEAAIRAKAFTDDYLKTNYA